MIEDWRRNYLTPKLVGKIVSLLSPNSVMYAQQYIMSTGDARRSQSTISFGVLQKQGGASNRRSDKRARKETEGINTTVIFSQVSVATTTDKTVTLESQIIVPPRLLIFRFFSIQDIRTSLFQPSLLLIFSHFCSHFWV